jgi:D-arabinose 1-dehydrogenase-like Zn-dependent alcohol dehydrogenase
MDGHSAIVVDIDAAKRDAAKKAGAVAVVDPKAANAVDQIKTLTKGGAWAVIDLVGSSQSARLGYDSLVKGGKYIIVGLYGGDLTVSLPPIPMRALTIQGSYVGSVPEMAELMALVRSKGLPDVPVSTRPLKDVNAVHDELRAGKVQQIVNSNAGSRVLGTRPGMTKSGERKYGRQRIAWHAGADQGPLQERRQGGIHYAQG